jgi:hypothetical protein
MTLASWFPVYLARLVPGRRRCRHHRPGGLQRFLAARILLARVLSFLTLERNRRVHLAGSFWTCIVSVRTGPGSGCRGARSCSLISVRRVVARLHSHRDELCPHIASLPDRRQILLVS